MHCQNVMYQTGNNRRKDQLRFLDLYGVNVYIEFLHIFNVECSCGLEMRFVVLSAGGANAIETRASANLKQPNVRAPEAFTQSK